MFGNAARAAEKAPSIRSPDDLWMGYDPEALPLDVTSIRAWTEETGNFESLRFTGEVAEGTPVRVFAIQGAPRDGAARAGVLHVHGGGQTASLEWVRYWVSRGYVCVTFDFCGPWENRTEVTDWGPIQHANMKHASGGFQMHPTPRESSWYHWTIVSRRALTLLARHPKVDPKRLGVFGISVGGTLTWMIAGSDRRVKAAAPIYGCGYNYDRRNVIWGLPAPSDDLQLFQRVVSAEAHAPYVQCPVLFFNSTNDFHGLMDRAYETLGAVKAQVRQVFTPRYNHHIEPEEGRDLALWMDWHLNGGKRFPASPVLSIDLDGNGVPLALVEPLGPDEVRKVDVFYAIGTKRPTARFWRSATAARIESDRTFWTAALPVLDAWDDLRAFANVTYASGVRLSTNLSATIPAQLGRARETLVHSDQLAHGEAGLAHWYFTNGYTDPMLDWSYLETGNDPDVGPFIGMQLAHSGDPVAARLSTHLIGDPQFRGREGQALVFACRGTFTDAGLSVTLIEDDWGPRARRFVAKIPKAELDVNAGWRQIVLPLSRFADTDGKPPASWSVIDKLELEGNAARSDPPLFAQLRWESPKDK